MLPRDHEQRTRGTAAAVPTWDTLVPRRVCVTTPNAIDREGTSLVRW